MNKKLKLKNTLILGLFFLGLGGWLLHTRIHPISKDKDFLIPFATGITSILILPLLFWLKRTIGFAYVLNGFIAIIGTVTMAHYSVLNFKGPVSLVNILFTTTLADIFILWGKFAIGKSIFDLETLKSDADIAAKGRFFRYPNMGWWWIHLIAVASVYAIGNIFWK